jgi:LmbE family N-acetylglucosaminyl deacetylase
VSSARSFLRGAKEAQVVVHRFRDGFFPSEIAEIKSTFEDVKRAVSDPDLVLTHYRDDRHQDHRAISDLTWNTFRTTSCSSTRSRNTTATFPNCFVPLSRQTCDRKVKYVLRAFKTQRDRHWFSGETFLGLMRLRGVECRAKDGYAEAFYARKLVVGL